MTNGVDEESDAFMDAVMNGQDAQTKRLIRVIDNRFRSQRRRMLGLETTMAGILPLVAEIKLLRRALVAVPTGLAILAGVAKLMGWA